MHAPVIRMHATSFNTPRKLQTPVLRVFNKAIEHLMSLKQGWCGYDESFKIPLFISSKLFSISFAQKERTWPRSKTLCFENFDVAGFDL